MSKPKDRDKANSPRNDSARMVLDQLIKPRSSTTPPHGMRRFSEHELPAPLSSKPAAPSWPSESWRQKRGRPDHFAVWLLADGRVRPGPVFHSLEEALSFRQQHGVHRSDVLLPDGSWYSEMVAEMESDADLEANVEQEIDPGRGRTRAACRVATIRLRRRAAGRTRAPPPWRSAVGRAAVERTSSMGLTSSATAASSAAAVSCDSGVSLTNARVLSSRAVTGATDAMAAPKRLTWSPSTTAMAASATLLMACAMRVPTLRHTHGDPSGGGMSSMAVMTSSAARLDCL